MHTFLDLETIPGQSSYESFLKDAQENFKAPSSLTKGQACDDLGITGNDAKYLSKDDAVAKWEKEFSTTRAPEVAEENWRRTALDGGKGEVVSIAWAVEDDDVVSVQRDYTSTAYGEAELISDFYAQLFARLKGRKPFFVGQYIAGFDLQFLFLRSVILGIRPPFDLPFNGRHEQHFYDTKIAWGGFKGTASQDSICKALGIQGKPDDIDGSKVWDFVKSGKIDRVAEYNRDDVEKNRMIYKRLNFIDTINQMTE